MEAWLLKVVGSINAFLADYFLLALLLGVGIWYTVKTKFVQVRCFGQGMKTVFGNISFKGKKEKSGMSSFQAFATAVAGQVGTGNIIGASGAILAGGPGAIFWMWIIAFLGMATVYAEAVMAQKTREVDENGNVSGGPVYYIKKAFPNKFGGALAVFFAVACMLALGFIGAMVQSNSIGEAISNATGGVVPTWVIGLLHVVLCGIIFIGGVSRLAAVSEKLVPIMAVLYLLGGLVVIVARITFIPEALGMIFKYAFNPQAIIGGTVGMAIKTALSQGAKRGLFSNEAGMGSTPHA
ncbi:MAG: sodium:alanine symporter family protein, partial [Clostridia bacterium]|nr:sodium:alanine symporter family protein [Clostridia bacterium]